MKLRPGRNEATGGPAGAVGAVRAGFSALLLATLFVAVAASDAAAVGAGSRSAVLSARMVRGVAVVRVDQRRRQERPCPLVFAEFRRGGGEVHTGLASTPCERVPTVALPGHALIDLPPPARF